MDPESINSVFTLFDYYGDILYELLIAGSWTRCYQSDAYEAFAGGLMNRGKRAFILGEQRKKGQILRGSKTTLGNREHKKTNFEGMPIYFRGTREQETPTLRGLRISLRQYIITTVKAYNFT